MWFVCGLLSCGECVVFVSVVCGCVVILGVVCM